MRNAVTCLMFWAALITDNINENEILFHRLNMSDFGSVEILNYYGSIQTKEVLIILISLISANILAVPTLKPLVFY